MTNMKRRLRILWCKLLIRLGLRGVHLVGFDTFQAGFAAGMNHGVRLGQEAIKRDVERWFQANGFPGVTWTTTEMKQPTPTDTRHLN